jgi:hypothetical protein
VSWEENKKQDKIRLLVEFVKRYWPLLTALVLLYAVVAACLVVSLRQNGGHLVYALDDTYIHMAIARNFSEHGVWGVTSWGFSSTSSSLLWVLLLALDYYLFGVNEYSPLVLNLVFATATVCLFHFIFKRWALSEAFSLAALVAVIFIAPMPLLIFEGMEHVLHIFLTVLFFYLSVTVLAGKGPGDTGHAAFNEKMLFVVGPLLVMSRYEGGFLVLSVCLFFAMRRRFIYAFILGAISSLPAALYGLVSVSKGWYLVPNSILLKGHMVNFTSLEGILAQPVIALAQAILIMDVLLPPLVASVIFFIKFRDRADEGQYFKIMFFVFLVTTLLHLNFARVGSLHRYEAYIVSLGALLTVLALREYFSGGIPLRVEWKAVGKFLVAACMVYLVFSPLVTRGLSSLVLTPRTTTKIYQQQYQMGLFLKNHYKGEAVTVNDIGAVSFLADIKLLDAKGVGSMEVSRLMRQGVFNVDKLEELQSEKGVSMAIVYDEWIHMPKGSIKVGEWTRTATGDPAPPAHDDTVSFYALDPEGSRRLAKNLLEFSPRLPEGVLQGGMYIDSGQDP